MPWRGIWPWAFTIAVTGCGPAPSDVNSLVIPGSGSPVANVSPEPAVSMTPESPAPPQVSLQSLDWAGVEKLIARQRGKVVLVNIWTTTCSTCTQEFPRLVALQERFGKQGLVCLAVNCDYDGIQTKPPEFYRPLVLKFLGQHPPPTGFDNVLLSVPFIEILEKLNLSSTPAVIVYGRNGELVKRFDNDQATRSEEEFTHQDVALLVEKLLTP
jgi:thiol-disulfide isomerase/thioredoxin